MKKLFLLPVLMFAGFCGYAQQISLMPEIGVNMSNFYTKISGSNNTNYTHANSMLPAGHIGLSAKILFTKHIGIQPGVYFNLNRSKDEETNFGVTTSQKNSVNGVHVPVYLVYYQHAKGSGFFGGIGPFANYYFSGTTHINASNGGSINISQKRDVTFGNDKNDDMRPVDYGGSVTIGYMLPLGLMVRAYFNLGLANLYPKEAIQNVPGDWSAKSREVGLSVGYRF